MFSNTAIDVFIGLIFVILLYSLLATIVQELMAVKFAFRSKILERAVLHADGLQTFKIFSTDTSGAGTARNTSTAAAPVTVNVNPNSGEEAVG